MCPNNTPLVICGTPVQSYRDKPKASIRFCLSTKATIFFAIVRANIFPPAADQDEFTTTFLPRLRVLCNVEQGPDFAAIVHDRFNAMVRDHVVAWAGRRGVWVQGPDGGYAWNQEVVDEHFGSVETIRVWLRASGILEPWEHMDLDSFGAASSHSPPVKKAAAGTSLAASFNKSLNLEQAGSDATTQNWGSPTLVETPPPTPTLAVHLGTTPAASRAGDHQQPSFLQHSQWAPQPGPPGRSRSESAGSNLGPIPPTPRTHRTTHRPQTPRTSRAAAPSPQASWAPSPSSALAQLSLSSPRAARFLAREEVLYKLRSQQLEETMKLRELVYFGHEVSEKQG